MNLLHAEKKADTMKTDGMIRQAHETMEGDGVTVRRLFPIAGMRNHDPFVLWDHFSISAGHGFPSHPHRGFEAITYLFSGHMQHVDNLGNHSTISAGGVQRFTAGRGIVHSEMPAGNDVTEGIQLWINLPQRLKQIEPAYQAAAAEQIKTEQWDGGWRRVIVGTDSPVKLQTAVDYFELGLEAKSNYQWSPAAAHSGLVYMVSGEAVINNQHRIKAADALLMDSASTLNITAVSAAKLMVCFGAAHHEPIYQHGPYVD